MASTNLESYVTALEANECTDLVTDLAGYEIRVLWMMDGGPELPGGAAMGAACEHLAGRGLCSRGPNFQITDAGRQALATINATGASPSSTHGGKNGG